MNDVLERHGLEWRYCGMLAALAMGILLLVPEPVLALQAHERPEGLVAHQLAHVFFGTAMGILAYWLESNRFVRSPGWRMIQIACLLLVLWNVVTFAGHMTALQIQPPMVETQSSNWLRSPGVNQSAWSVRSVLSLDHLVCVPAVLFLWVGFRKLYREIGEEEKAGQ